MRRGKFFDSLNPGKDKYGEDFVGIINLVYEDRETKQELKRHLEDAFATSDIYKNTVYCTSIRVHRSRCANGACRSFMGFKRKGSKIFT